MSQANVEIVRALFEGRNAGLSFGSFARYFDPDDLREVGNQVVAIGTVNGRGRASGIALEFRSAIVVQFGSDHRITRARIYPDVNEALKAVGLEE